VARYIIDRGLYGATPIVLPPAPPR
jgi:hypothetical protein